MQLARIISAVAGLRAAYKSNHGDNIAATSAALPFPCGVWVDVAVSNIYVSVPSDNLIRSVKRSTGIITTIAGNGVYGYSDGDGIATAASFATPWGIWGDSLVGIGTGSGSGDSSPM